MGDHPHHDDEHDRPLSGPALRVKALESLLTEKGLVDPRALDELIDTYETKVGPRNGARVVARDSIFVDLWDDHLDPA
jgi:nitrile hydratase